MNIMFLILSIGMILSYSFYACWDKHISSDLLRKVYVGHENATRNLINSYASHTYEKLGNKQPLKEEEEIEPIEAVDAAQKKKKSPAANGECAKINLAPLINDGYNTHPERYKLAVEVLRYFYTPLDSDPQFADNLLQAIIAAAPKGKNEFLSKIDVGDMQQIYYKMLKGKKKSYPCLMDYFKIEQAETPLCYFHMHPDLAGFFFSKEVAWELHYEIHTHNGETPDQKLIERACRKKSVAVADPTIFQLFRWGGRHNRGDKITYHEEDGNDVVAVTKNVDVQ